VYFLHPDGTLGEFRTGPRGVAATFALPPGGVVLGCRIALTRRPYAEIQKELQQRLKAKKAAEPFALAAVGYVWKNPPGETAARLIERAGLQGKRISTVEVSSKCANIIVNRGHATAADVLALMELTRDRVQAHSGITLEPAIHVLGFAPVAFEPQALQLAAV
jgi:UDP-N-acetylmuramate dehydrogenase